MTTYYADFDLATGGNTGVDAANAWRSFADIVAGTNGTPPAAGDMVLCKGTDLMSSGSFIVFAGSASSGFVKLIGVDNSWNNVGGSTRAVLDLQGNSADMLTYYGASFAWLENFELKNGYRGIYGTSLSPSNSCVFINVYAHNFTNDGFAPESYIYTSTYIRCRSSNNGRYGWSLPRGSILVGCRADGNSNTGFMGNVFAQYVGCIAHDNGGDGFNGVKLPVNSVAYNNTGDGFEFGTTTLESPAVIGLRAAGNATGLKASTSHRIPLFYFYGDNITEIDAYYDEVLNDGAGTVTLNGTDTDAGFVDPSNEDYNLASDATYRREAVTIP